MGVVKQGMPITPPPSYPPPPLFGTFCNYHLFSHIPDGVEYLEKEFTHVPYKMNFIASHLGIERISH